VPTLFTVTIITEAFAKAPHSAGLITASGFLAAILVCKFGG